MFDVDIVIFWFQTFCKSISNCVKVCWLATCTRNNKWGTCFINQNGVHFVHNTEIVPTLHLVVFANLHIVTQIVKAKFIVCAVSDVAFICLFLFWCLLTSKSATDSKPQKFVKFAHHFCLCCCQVFVNSNNMHIFASECV